MVRLCALQSRGSLCDEQSKRVQLRTNSTHCQILISQVPRPLTARYSSARYHAPPTARYSSARYPAPSHCQILISQVPRPLTARYSSARYHAPSRLQFFSRKMDLSTMFFLQTQLGNPFMMTRWRENMTRAQLCSQPYGFALAKHNTQKIVNGRKNPPVNVKVKAQGKIRQFIFLYYWLWRQSGQSGVKTILGS